MAYGFRQGAGIAETTDTPLSTLPACTLAAPPSGTLVAVVGWTDAGGGVGAVIMPAGWIRLGGDNDSGTCHTDWWWLPAAGAGNQSTVFTLNVARPKLGINIVEYPSSVILVAPSIVVQDAQVTNHALPAITPAASAAAGLLGFSVSLPAFAMSGVPAGYTKRLETPAIGGSSAMHELVTQDVAAAAGPYTGTEVFADVVRWTGGQMALGPAPSNVFHGEPGGGVW